MNPSIILWLKSCGIIFGILLLCIIIHEFGHAFAYYQIKKKWLKPLFNRKGYYFSLGDTKDFDELTDEEYSGIVWAGIGLGFIPVFIAALIYVPAIYLSIAVLYVIGCKDDLRIIYQNNKNKELNQNGNN